MTPEEPTQNATREVSASGRFIQLMILGVLFALPVFWAMGKPNVTDPDIWWHLSIGDWVLQHHAVPHKDFISRAVAGQPWQAYSWLFDLLIATLYRHLGLPALVLYTAAMFGAIAVALFRLASRSLEFISATGLTLLAGACILPMETPRSWLFTILFSALTLDILLRARRSGKWRGFLWLPLIFMLWANLHIQFVHGLVLLGFALAESLWDYRRSASKTVSPPCALAIALLACVAATLVNPYGWHVYRVAFSFATQSSALKYVSETQPLTFRAPSHYCIALLAILAVVALVRRKQIAVFPILALAYGAYLSFHSQRDAWALTVVACGILGDGAVLPSAAVRSNTQRTAQPLPRWLPSAAWGVAFVVGLLMLRTPMMQPAYLAQSQKSVLPVDAAAFINAHHIEGPLFNDFDWGGYLFWSTGLPVSMDGRVAPYGAGRINRSVVTWRAESDRSTDPQFTSARLVVGPVTSPLVKILRADSGFQLVHEDKLAAVFITRTTP